MTVSLVQFSRSVMPDSSCNSEAQKLSFCQVVSEFTKEYTEAGK